MPAVPTPAERVALLAQKVQRRDLRLGPPLAEDVLADFESRRGCTLPEGYRAFLRQIGNGGRGPPDYGLLPLGDLPNDLTEAEARPRADPGRLARPFPFTRPWVWEGGEISDEGTADQIDDGTLHLGTDGCAQYWLLVVTGPERGNVWMQTHVGILPTNPKRDFLQWLEDWLDGTRDWWG